MFVPGTGTKFPKTYPFLDVECSLGPFIHRAAALCQAEKKTCSVKITCEKEDYLPVEGRCYKVYSREMSYDAAQSTCVSDGATLIEPRSNGDLKILRSLGAPHGPLGRK